MMEEVAIFFLSLFVQPDEGGGCKTNFVLFWFNQMKGEFAEPIW